MSELTFAQRLDTLAKAATQSPEILAQFDTLSAEIKAAEDDAMKEIVAVESVLQRTATTQKNDVAAWIESQNAELYELCIKNPAIYDLIMSVIYGAKCWTQDHHVEYNAFKVKGHWDGSRLILKFQEDLGF